MKKKWLIVLMVVLVFGVGLLVGLYFYNEHLEKERMEAERVRLLKEEKEIDDMKEKLAFFESEQIIDKPKDELEEYFNDIIKVNNNVMSLKNDDININDLSNLDKVKKEKEECLNIDVSILDKDLNSIINKYSDVEKKVIKEVYNNSNIVKNKDNLVNKVNEYKEDVNKDIEFIEFLNNNKDKYYIKNKKVIYKVDEFKNEFLKYNNSFKLEKEVLGDLTILMYHGVRDDAWGITSLFVRPKEFESQMKYLVDNGYTPIFLSEIGNAKNYSKTVVITFDDGYIDVYQNAFPVLKKYNIKANFFIITNSLGRDAFVTKEMVKEMSDSGLVEIGSHTVYHSKLAKLDSEKLEMELRDSKNYLEELIGKEVTTLAYPEGIYNSNVIKMTKNYYKYAVTTVSGLEFSNKLNAYVLKRQRVSRGFSVDRFKELLAE